jgi:hypothetical protein
LKQIDGVEFVKCPKIFLLSGGARVPGWFYFGNRTEGQIKNLNEIREIRKWQVWHVCQQTESYSKNYGTKTHKKKLIAQNLFEESSMKQFNL